MSEKPSDGVGYLEWAQWERLNRAIDNTRRYVPWLRIAGYIRAGDADEERHRSTDPTIPLPATWLAAEEISRLMNEMNQWPELEDAVNTLDGQFFALLLTREVETAIAKWPLEDKPHRVRYLRCRICQAMALRYYPPSQAGGEVIVKCQAHGCGAVEDHSMFERDALLIRMETERSRNAG
tara:strand:- start:1881 stop:2420 length:540 start_codon:yes stop_codon:yes gene_type:complete